LATANRAHLVDSLAADRLSLTANQRGLAAERIGTIDFKGLLIKECWRREGDSNPR
jgi:hypothetical protein